MTDQLLSPVAFIKLYNVLGTVVVHSGWLDLSLDHAEKKNISMNNENNALLLGTFIHHDIKKYIRKFI